MNMNSRFYMDKSDEKKKKKKSASDILNFKYSADDDGDDDELIETMNNHIYLYSDINNKSAFEIKKSFENVKFKIRELKDKYGVEPAIHLHINSYGGCVFSAFCIIDTIREAQKNGIRVYTYCEGKVASSGTLISVCGDKRYISKNAVMLIHELSSTFWGKFSEIEDEWHNVKMLMNKLKQVYKENTKMKKKDLDKILTHDLWLESDECLKNGFVDEII